MALQKMCVWVKLFYSEFFRKSRIISLDESRPTLGFEKSPQVNAELCQKIQAHTGTNVRATPGSHPVSWMVWRAAMILSACASFGLTVVRSDAASDDLLDRGYRGMYNLAFTDAHRCFRDWERSHPESPMGPVSDAAAYLFSEFQRLNILQSEFFVNDDSFFHRSTGTPDPAVKREFEGALRRGEELAEPIVRRSPDDETALFAMVLASGLRADYKALIEKRYWASLNDVKEARNRAEQLLAKHPGCYDAYLAIGVENYLLSLKPAPIRWILRMNGARTEKKVGLERLRLTAEKGRYLEPFAKLLLAVAALRDGNTEEGRRLLSELMRRFPGNTLYREEFRKLSVGT